jgi:hypothetical protein
MSTRITDMGNTRRFNPSRRQRVLGLKEQNKALRGQLTYAEGFIQGQQAIIAATKMERPPDLEEWVESILPDMNDAERAEWDAMDPADRAEFLDSLGEQINRSIKASESEPS